MNFQATMPKLIMTYIRPFPKVSTMKSFIHFFYSFIIFLGSVAIGPLWGASTHGASLYDLPKYGPLAQKLDYVSPQAKRGGRLVQGTLGNFNSLNAYIIKGEPALGLESTTCTLLFFPIDEPLSGYGYLAHSLELSPDKKSVTFTLRSNATFHDGTPITAQDVAFSFETLISKGKPIYQNYYQDVKFVEIIDPYKIRFHFKHSLNRELYLILGQIPIISRAYYQKNDFSKSTLDPILGCGPYRVKTVDQGRRITYERVHSWWGDDLWFNRYRHNFDEIEYRYYSDDSVMFEAMKSQDLNLYLEISTSRWVQGYDFPALTQGHIIKDTFIRKGSGLMSGLAINTRREPFHKVAFREALILAFDFEWLNDNLFHNYYQRITSYFWGTDLSADPDPTPGERDLLQSLEGQMDPRVLSNPFKMPSTDGSGYNRENLRLAKKRLQDCGYIYRDGKLVDPKEGRPIEITILIPVGGLKKVLNPYILQLKKLGIHARIKLVDVAHYQRLLDDFDFDLAYTNVAQSLSPGSEQIEFWGSRTADTKGSKNYPGIKDPIVDELVERLIKSQTRQELLIHTKALDRLLLWGSYFVPFYGNQIYRFARQKNLFLPNEEPEYRSDTMTWWFHGDRVKKGA